MFHIQRPTPDWNEVLSRLPDTAMIKATESYQLFQEVKAANPKIFTVHRMVRDSWQHYTGRLDSGWFNPAEAQRLARAWFEAFVDETFRIHVAPFCDSVSWHNEIWANSQTEIERQERIKATEAAVNVWNKEYRPTLGHDIQLVIGEAAVGNWMPRRIPELAIWSNNLVGYHPYDWWFRKERADPGWIAATALLFDAMELDWRLTPQWIFTENGPLESAVTGWRSDDCLGFDRHAYVDAVATWIRDVSRTAAYRQGRIKGFSLFTTGRATNTWKDFWTEQPELNMLAEMIREEWQPGTTQPPPPPPTPTKHTAIVVLVPQEYTQEQWISAAAYAYTKRHTLTASHDDTITTLSAGNERSYAKIIDAHYPSQQNAIKALNEHNLNWQPMNLEKESSTWPQP